MHTPQATIKNLPSIAGYREIMYQRQERNYPHMIFRDRRGVPINFNPFSLRVAAPINFRPFTHPVTDHLIMYAPRKSAFSISAFLKATQL